MQQFELLTKIGYQKEQIEELCKRGLMDFQNSDYVITDFELLLLVIERCLSMKVSPKAFLMPPMITECDDELDLLYRYIVRENYKLASNVCDMIIKKVPTGQLKLLKEGFQTYPDNLDYILDENVYNNEVVTEGLHNIERRLLIQLEEIDIASAVDTFELLQKVYPDVMDTAFFRNVYQLLNLISSLNSDKTYVSKNDPYRYEGDASAILTKLLESEDLYRSQNLIREVLTEYPNSIEWRIYLQGIAQAIYLNEQNLQTTMLRGIINSSIGQDLNEAFPNSSYPRISGKQIEELDSNPLEELEDHDFFEEYENAYYDEHDYAKAKEKLLQHMKQDVVNGISNSYDYLLDDVNMLINNEKLGVNMKDFNISYDFALNYLNDSDYKTAILYLARAQNMLLEKSPRLYSLIAKCYNELENKEKAVYYYKMAFEGNISPDSLYEMMQLCIEVENYDLGLEAYNRFCTYYDKEFPKVKYMAAIIFNNLGMYDDAEEAIYDCSLIIEDDVNLYIPFTEELEIEADLKKGKKRKLFGLDDYIEYENNPDEDEMINDLDDHYNLALEVGKTLDEKDSSYKKKICYMLSVAKVLFQGCRFEDGLEICSLVEPNIDENLLKPEETKIYKKMLKTFKKYEKNLDE